MSERPKLHQFSLQLLRDRIQRSNPNPEQKIMCVWSFLHAEDALSELLQDADLKNTLPPHIFDEREYQYFSVPVTTLYTFDEALQDHEKEFPAVSALFPEGHSSKILFYEDGIFQKIADHYAPQHFFLERDLDIIKR